MRQASRRRAHQLRELGLVSATAVLCRSLVIDITHDDAFGLWRRERGGGVHGCGMYATVPMLEGEGKGYQKRTKLNLAGGPQLGLHVDGLACSLGCVGYIDDVPPDGGGFAIYPGCHRRMYHAFENRCAVTTTDAYAKVQKLCGDYQKPFTFEGNAGDVVSSPLLTRSSLMCAG